ncbi:MULTISPECIES: DNA polymerase Y family protein [unclassified Beijerinckia]|uniref:Y-family DNA polymerase n=1 Tax=unclassified Beijerinckia TaxID=2638183 RepID=UPI001FCD035E|nr:MULTISPECIES: DNA polymerase Y family protein [unclassified Beijerinckia]MDH7797750.1 protein ImuB [Beijerinckia sp. GAS462]
MPAANGARAPEGLQEAPLVVIDKIKGALRLVAVDQRALSLGLTPGLALADARARVPDLQVTPLDAHIDTACLERLADLCDRWTPLVALDPPHGLLLDISGCAHLFGGEAELGKDMRRRFSRSGLDLRLAIAGTPDAARALARFGRGGIIAPGVEAQSVGALPIAALGVDPQIVHGLSRAGLKTIAALTERSSTPLAARFGDDLIARLDRVCGRVDIRITPRRMPPACMAERPFADPIARMEDIEATLERLLQRIADLLQQRGEGGRRFEASFFRADGAVRTIMVETGHPSRDPKTILRLYRERLEALADPLDPGFGFDLIRILVPVAEPLDAAQVSLDGKANADSEVADLVDKLVARFGRDRVQHFVPRDTHDPHRRAFTVPATGTFAPAHWDKPEPDEPPLRPLHIFNPPQPVLVTAQVPDGPPARFVWRRASHEIVLAEGPERIASEWWRREHDVPTRDYYRVEDMEGRRFWIFRDGLYEREVEKPQWYLHGLFA